MKREVDYEIGGIFCYTITYDDYEDFHLYRKELTQQLHGELMEEVGAW